jgi:hypothetical protein
MNMIIDEETHSLISLLLIDSLIKEYSRYLKQNTIHTFSGGIQLL